MPFNMNTVDKPGINAGIDGSPTPLRIENHWTPTHNSASSSKQAATSNGIKSKCGSERCQYPVIFEAPTTSLSSKNRDIPLPSVPSSSSSPPKFSMGYPSSVGPTGLDQQEKVRVRLVQNRGLVVEEPEDTPYDDGTSSRENDFKSRAKLDYGLVGPAMNGQVNCLKNSNRSACPGHYSKISSSSLYRGAARISPPPPKYLEVDDPTVSLGCDDQPRVPPPSCSSPFSRTRHGSSSTGVSSMTPLMGATDQVKDNHKIQVIVKSSSSMKLQQGGSNIHLYCALVLGFSASLFFSLTLLLAKVLKNRDHHPISIAFWRYLGILLPSVPLVLFYLVRGKKNKVMGAIWPIQDMDKAANALALLMRGVLGSTALILRFCSLNYLTIGDSSVISYCAPVFAAIFAPLCVKKESGGVIPMMVGLLSAFGILLVCRPPFLGGGGGGFDGNTLKGVFLAILSMLCGSGVLIIVRNLLQKVHFSLMMFVLGIWGVFEAGVLAISLDVLKVPELLPDIVMMFGVAFLTFFGQLFVLLAMRMGHVGSAVSVIRSCDIFLSFLWQYLFLKTEPEIFSVLSAILVILAVWFICFRKWLITLRENHLMRQRLSLMLY